MIQHVKLRAPSENGGVLLRPELDRLKGLVAQNREIAQRNDFAIAGRKASELREALRGKVLKLAGETTRHLCPGRAVEEPEAEAPLIMTGHQSEIFHPGVWFKNHLADRLARAVGGTSVNLVLDTDVPEVMGLRMPVRRDDSVELREFRYAPTIAGRTWEEHLRDETWEVERFVREVTEALGEEAGETLFAEFGEGMIECSERARNASEVAAGARSGVEYAAGIENLEVNAGGICETREFMLFALAMVCEMERFRGIYNEALGAYRKLHRLRGKANPLPDLGVEEAPFWAYAKGSVRRALKVRPGKDGLELLAEEKVFLTISGPRLAGMRAGKAEAFEATSEEMKRACEENGIRVRTRALTTTMLLRLFAADVFIHGIGGADYDTITDEMMRQFFGVEPPGFVTASATMRLGLEKFPGTEEEVRRVKKRIRELRYSPEKHIPEEARRREEVGEVLRRKQELITRERGETRQERRRMFEGILEANTRMHGLVAPEEERARRELARMEREVAMNRILEGREYAFVLFRREELLGFYERTLAGLK